MGTVTNRTFYSNEYKAKVIDQAESEGIAESARKNGIAYNNVYSWTTNAKTIRKAAEKERKAAAKKKPKKPELVRAATEEKPEAEEKPAVETTGRVLVSSDAHPAGPEFTVRGFGGWLLEVVKRELPAVVEANFDGLVEKRLDALIERKVKQAIHRALHEGTTGEIE